MSEKCKICGLANVSPSHLNKIHKINLYEYKEKYSPDLKWDTGRNGLPAWNKGKQLKGNPKYSKMGHRTPHSEATKELCRQKKIQNYLDDLTLKDRIGAADKKYFKEHPDCMKERDRLHSIRMSGPNHPMYNKHHSEKSRKLMRESNLAYLEKHPEVAEEKVRQMCEANALNNHHSKVMLEKYQDPIFHERVMRAQFKNRKISSYEQKLIDLIKEYNLPYKYVGNGEVWIGKKNPDFININGEKKLIEVYSLYHLGFKKDKDYEVIRSKHFAKYGFNTVFINENDFNCDNWKDNCINKLG